MAAHVVAVCPFAAPIDHPVQWCQGDAPGHDVVVGLQVQVDGGPRGGGLPVRRRLLERAVEVLLAPPQRLALPRGRRLERHLRVSIRTIEQGHAEGALHRVVFGLLVLRPGPCAPPRWRCCAAWSSRARLRTGSRRPPCTPRRP